MFKYLAAAVALVLLPQAKPNPTSSRPPGHERRQIHGFTVNIDSRLLQGDHTALGELALDRLACQLSTVSLLVQPDRLVHLRKVNITLDLNNGELRSPQYHPSVDWLIEHGYDPALAKCVHIPDAVYFTDPRFQREQPFAILHELAHSYHDQVLGFNNPDILAAYDRVKASGKFNSVLHISGKMLPHYALTDHKEFFAEMTETYFGANDFYPFNSAELQRDEPELYLLMQKMWGPLK